MVVGALPCSFSALRCFDVLLLHKSVFLPRSGFVQPTLMDSFSTIAISGGGSKGPYACGVLQAIAKYTEEKAINLRRFYAGTSVGALNATLAAQGDLTELAALYGRLTTKDVLGKKDATVSKFRLWKRSGTNPFSYFDNKSLRKLIASHASFVKLADAHLAICATNYLTGSLETFYVSKHIDQFLEFEKTLDARDRRLNNYHRISNQEELVDALLASASIPFFFPPVRIGGRLYVDGGVGNNTPLRQVAYFSRFLSELSIGETLLPVCIVNDPGRFTIEDMSVSTNMFSIIKRSIDIFQNELVTDSMIAWHRINKEVSHNDRKVAELSAYVDSINLEQSTKANLHAKIKELLGKSTAATARKDIAMSFVMPSTPLVEDVLRFDPAQSTLLRRRGVADALAALAHGKQIDHIDQASWVEQIA
jgi:predicted acylesterase/phospholipase RssA